LWTGQEFNIEERSFVAKEAPLDDGQRPVDGKSSVNEEADAPVSGWRGNHCGVYGSSPSRGSVLGRHPERS
jgi:hypothetical protein